MVRVQVPATTANLGPGFDALGMALDLYNTVEMAEAARLSIEVTGEGAGQLPDSEKNIVVLAAREVFRLAGRPVGGLAIRLTNSIPLSRGLGSSAAARVGAIVAANRMCGDALDNATLLSLATRLEGHPDNVAPALLGGLVVSAVEPDGEVHSLKVAVADPPAFVVLVPDAEVSTEAARSVLPDAISRADACFNVSRASLLTASLISGKREHLTTALQDRIHQPYRSRIMPWFDSVVSAAVESGAYGAVLSGAGSSILAMCPEAKAEEIGAAMLQTLKDSGQPGRCLNLRIDTAGAQASDC